MEARLACVQPAMVTLHFVQFQSGERAVGNNYFKTNELLCSKASF